LAQKRANRNRKMAEDEARAARLRSQQANDEAAIVLVDALQAFFEGRAALYVEPLRDGGGSTVRFYKDGDSERPA
jgi:hypothetical protein